jgi:hypothetical protein
VGRAFGLALLLVPLAVGAYLLIAQMGGNGSTASLPNAETRAQSAVAASNFQTAGTALQAWFVEHTSYTGATLPPETNVVLVRADATTYCLQTVAAPVEHEVGPGGQPQAGPCM